MTKSFKWFSSKVSLIYSLATDATKVCQEPVWVILLPFLPERPISDGTRRGPKTWSVWVQKEMLDFISAWERLTGELPSPATMLIWPEAWGNCTLCSSVRPGTIKVTAKIKKSCLMNLMLSIIFHLSQQCLSEHKTCQVLKTPHYI